MGTCTTIHVTQSDIDKALKNHSSRCVVATAVKRAVPNAKRVEVDMQTIRWTDEGGDGATERVIYVTPASVMDYIVSFDAGDPILPFTFRLYHDRKATIPEIVRNTAARQVDAARARVRYQEKKQEKIASSPTATKTEKVVAAKKVGTAKQELAVVKKAVGPEAVTTKKMGNSTHWRIPRHSKTGRRYFGAKVMRVNQQPQQPAAKPAAKAKSTPSRTTKS